MQNKVLVLHLVVDKSASFKTNSTLSIRSCSIQVSYAGVLCRCYIQVLYGSVIVTSMYYRFTSMYYTCYIFYSGTLMYLEVM